MKIKEARSIIKSPFFPAKFSQNKNYKYSVCIGLGGNIGDVKKRFERFFFAIKKDSRFFLKESSIILKNKAFGFREQNDFLNAIILLKTSLHARAILKIMQYYEIKFKRTRSFKNAPRTLDLDILYFSEKIRQSDDLQIPHHGVNERISVIIPLGSMKETI